VSRQCVSAYKEGPNGVDYTYGASTQGDGSYEIQVPSGVYRVRVWDCPVYVDEDDDGHYELAEEFADDLAEQWYVNGWEYETATPVQVAGANRTGINIQQQIGGTISGTVTRDGGTPAAGVCVSADDHDNRIMDYTPTNADGTYVLKGLAQYAHFVQIIPGGCEAYGDILRVWYDDAHRITSATPVPVNVGANTPSINFDFGQALPGTVFTGGPAHGSTIATTSTSFPFAAAPSEEGIGFECQTDAGAWATCVSPASLTGLSAGGHTFRVRAKNSSAVDPTPATRTFNVQVPDTTPPDTQIVSGPAGGATITTSSTSFSFGTVSGESATFECQVDGGPWTTCTSPAGLSGLSNGSHTFSVRAKDSSGNKDASPASRTFTVAVATAPPPSVTPAAPMPGATPACTSATAALAAAKAAVVTATKKVASTTKKLKALKKADALASKIKAAKKKLKQAKAAQEDAEKAESASQAAVGSVC
jgi:hypothetical protein